MQPDEDESPEVASDLESAAADQATTSPKRTSLAKRASGSSRLGSRDPLAQYMSEVQRYELLSQDEEHDLATRFVEKGDLDAAQTLVTSNLRLVVKIAYDYRQAYRNILDLVQEGNIGLMQAVRKFDPYKGVKLSTYAAWWIRAYILRFILNNHRLVKIGTTQAQRKLFFNLKKEKARLAAMGIEATHEQIAERLEVPLKDVVQMDRRLAAGDMSLDVPVGTPEGGRATTRMELLPGSSAPIDDTLADVQIHDRLFEKIYGFGSTLEGKEKAIFESRLLSEEPKTLQALGDEFGVSRERVRQIEKRLVQKIRSHLGETLGQRIIDVYEQG